MPLSRLFLHCGIAGWCIEILFTACKSLQRHDFQLVGTTSLWMFPIYGSAAFLTPVMRRMKDASFLMRGLVYMSCIFLGEYVSGILLKRQDLCPWDYSKSPFNIQSVIRLDYAPVWFLVGLFFERILLRETPRKIFIETS